MSDEWRMVFEESNRLSNNPLGGTLQHSTIEAMTIRELRAFAATLGVDPITLLPKCDPERVTTNREATS